VAAMADSLIADPDKEHQNGLLIISRGTAILLFGVYIAYLIFQLKTHASLFIPRQNRRYTEDDLTGDLDARSGEFIPELVGDIARMSVLAASLRCVHGPIPFFSFLLMSCSAFSSSPLLHPLSRTTVSSKLQNLLVTERVI
jgi:Ca2+/H+ antiporter